MPLELCSIAKGQRRLKLSPDEQVLPAYMIVDVSSACWLLMHEWLCMRQAACSIGHR